MFEWDEAKRQATIKARGLDFIDAELLFDGRPVFTLTSDRRPEIRFLSVGILDDGKFHTVVWTSRGEAKRIISFRRARVDEERAYRQIFG
jgi:uncharacterized DUF497 family protein